MPKCRLLHVVPVNSRLSCSGTIPPFIVDEMFTEDARPAAASAALAVNWFSELVVVVTFPLLEVF